MNSDKVTSEKVEREMLTALLDKYAKAYADELFCDSFDYKESIANQQVKETVIDILLNMMKRGIM